VYKKSSAAPNQIRLFMLPGMAHCFGGSGPSRVDWVGALDQWMATDRAPESLIASKPSNPLVALAGLPTETLQTRPVCAWPKHAEWNGSGSTDDAANFPCVVATK
jgi:Tannase and feruloyl esterase